MDRHMHRKASERWAAFSLMGNTNYETWKLSMFLANIQIEEKVYCIKRNKKAGSGTEVSVRRPSQVSVI